MMGSIYRSAQEVIIWTGPTLELEPRRVTLFDELMPRLRAIYGQTMPDYWQRLLQTQIADFKILWDALIAWNCFLDRSWVMRAWTFQEALLAARARFLFGSSLVDWKDAIDLTNFANDHQSDDSSILFCLDMERKRENTQMRNSHSAPDLMVIDFLRKSFHSLKQEVKRAEWLLDVVQHGRSPQCGDLKDKIYAFTGIVNYAAPCPTRRLDRSSAEHGTAFDIDRLISPSRRFPIRYDCSFEKTNYDFTCWAINNAPIISLYTTRGMQANGRRKLPSWAPDFSVSQALRNHQIPTPYRSEVRSDAEAFALLNTRKIRDSHLVVVGHLLDVVVETDSDPVNNLLYPHGTPTILQSLFHFRSRMPSHEFPREAAIEALWRTLICDVEAVHDPAIYLRIASYPRITPQPYKPATGRLRKAFRAFLSHSLASMALMSIMISFS